MLSTIPGTKNAKMNTAWPHHHEIYSTLQKEDQWPHGRGNDGPWKVADEGRHRERHVAYHHSSVRTSRIKLHEDSVPLPAQQQDPNTAWHTLVAQ